ncbi:MAG: hypothetical protein HQM03_21870 [Magnetococcales bacterium]|nr:hypothetical protein [Magnetococcales bacterium]
MSIGSSVFVPPIRFGGFNSVRGRVATGTPAQTIFVGIDQRTGVGVTQTPVAAGTNPHAGVAVPPGTTATGTRSITSYGIIIGGQMVTAQAGEPLIQVWSE